MSFGNTIKSLRKSANLTQERLAEILSISPQAVSRWETNIAMPDISLLPPLANLFNVTTDYLLGMDTYSKDLRKKEFDEAFFEYWKKENKEDNYLIALQATAEYPGNMNYFKWLADNEFYLSFEKDENERLQLLESAINHCRVILSDCADDNLYNETLHMIVLVLSNLNRLDEAKKYAMLQNDIEKRNDLLCLCLTGNELRMHKQNVRLEKLSSFIASIYENNMESHELILKIYNLLFPDGNLNYFYDELEHHHFMKCALYCLDGDEDKAVEEFEYALFYARKMKHYRKQAKYYFTSKLFDTIEGFVNNDKNFDDVEELINFLQKDERFMLIKNNKKIENMIK